MNILHRYLAGSLLRGYLPVLAVFLSVFSLLAFIEELDQVGKGRYTLMGAGEVLLLTLPSRFVFLAPFIALLGSIMALGGLANGRELIAMQASGVSPYQITGAVIKVVIVFILMVGCLEEFVAPFLDQRAHLKRYVALSDTRAYQGEEGLWFREGTRFVRIQKVMYGEVPQGIDIFEFDKEGNLKVYLHAQEAEVKNPQIWTLKNIKRNMISGLGFTEEYVSRLDWKSPLKQEEMKLLTLPTAFLAPSDLYQYIGVLQRKKHNSLRYELAFWEKVFMPFTTGLMILVALPCVFGPLRRATMGKRIFWGALAGFGYFLIKEILEPIALLIGASPLITTVTPFLLLSAATIVFWRKYFH